MLPHSDFIRLLLENWVTPLRQSLAHETRCLLIIVAHRGRVMMCLLIDVRHDCMCFPISFSHCSWWIAQCPLSLFFVFALWEPRRYIRIVACNEIPKRSYGWRSRAALCLFRRVCSCSHDCIPENTQCFPCVSHHLLYEWLCTYTRLLPVMILCASPMNFETSRVNFSSLFILSQAQPLFLHEKVLQCTV